MQNDNKYLKEIKINLPRIISLFDTDETSLTYGLGDRFYWAWGLIDFSNATFQGVTNGMARLWVNNLWPYVCNEELFLKRIFNIGIAVKKITSKDGSLQEAFPNEGSYCVTALVAFDMLLTLDLLKDKFGEDRKKHWLKIIKPLINYLIQADEEHAFISNHLATAVAALIRWERETNNNEGRDKAFKILNRIMKRQSIEGWYLEYEGFDAGYQSLCTYYLADVYEITKEKKLLESLKNSLKFLWNFAHPDGSFGGIYGSRNTRFYFPGGILALSEFIPEAKELSDFMELSISQQNVITLSSIDEPNLIPMFNSYCWAACNKNNISIRKNNNLTLPAISKNKSMLFFKDAGILIDKSNRHYSIISTHKGGVTYHFNYEKKALIDTGLIVLNKKNCIGSSQSFSRNNPTKLSKNYITIKSQISSMTKKTPNSIQFIILRILGLYFFKKRFIREIIKKLLVKLLITKKDYWGIYNERKISLGENLEIKDKIKLKSGYKLNKDLNNFVHIHMSSKGYWQKQDEIY